eukprot:13535612-Ditylum_brightwellii.AAC.1
MRMKLTIRRTSVAEVQSTAQATSTVHPSILSQQPQKSHLMVFHTPDGVPVSLKLANSEDR